MNSKILVPVIFISLIASINALAAIGKVTISSPQSGATISSKDKVVLNYDTTLSAYGDHLHLNVDGKRVDIIHKLKGSTEVGSLSSGKHHICLVENTKGHTPTGAEGCVDVIVK